MYREKEEEKSFIINTTIKMIDQELDHLEEITKEPNPMGYGEGRVGPGHVIHQGVLTGTHQYLLHYDF